QLVCDVNIEIILLRPGARDADRTIPIDRRRGRCHLPAAEIEDLHIDLAIRRTRRALRRWPGSLLCPRRKGKQRAARRQHEARHRHIKDPSVVPEANPAGSSTVALQARSPIRTFRTLGLPRSRPLTYTRPWRATGNSSPASPMRAEAPAGTGRPLASTSVSVAESLRRTPMSTSTPMRFAIFTDFAFSPKEPSSGMSSGSNAIVLGRNPVRRGITATPLASVLPTGWLFAYTRTSAKSATFTMAKLSSR